MCSLLYLFNPLAIRMPHYILPLFSGILLLTFVLFSKEEKKELQAVEDNYRNKMNTVFRLFRHELMNQLQVIFCLCQMGKKDRLEKALNCLNQKLKCYGDVSQFNSPDFMSILGELIFSVPSEASINIDIPSSLDLKSPLGPELKNFVKSLQGFIRSSKTNSLRLKLNSREGYVNSLEINIALSPCSYTPGDLYEYFSKSDYPLLERVEIKEKKPLKDILVNLRIPITHSSTEKVFVKEVLIKKMA